MSTGTCTTNSYFNATGAGGTCNVFMTALMNVLTAGGWVRTADTGQTSNYSAVNMAATATYQVWRMGDALQATNPVFLRIDTLANSQFVGDLTVGTGSNGSGTITGQIGPKIRVGPGSYNNLTSMPSYFCATNNTLQVYAFHSATATYPFYFSLERTRDGAGNPSSDGMVVVAKDSGSARQFYIPFTGSWVQMGEVKCFFPTGATSMANGANVVVAPILVATSSSLKNPMVSSLVYASADLTQFNPTTIPVLGTNHTYLPTGYSIGSALSPSAVFAMLYE